MNVVCPKCKHKFSVNDPSNINYSNLTSEQKKKFDEYDKMSFEELLGEAKRRGIL